MSKLQAQNEGFAYAPPPPQHHQPVVGLAVEEARPARNSCHMYCGWILFAAGFFILITWYVGLVLLIIFVITKDRREKPGYIACAITAVIATISIIIIAATGRGVSL